jgi:hypothetical protein
MKERTIPTDAFRSLSAIGAGVLLAATPHCGGKSEGVSDDSGGSANDRGGASGSAGTFDGPGMYGGGGYGGVGSGGYSGSYGGSYGGAVGTGGTVGIGGSAGSCPMGVITRCWEPAELMGCADIPDAGPDVIVVDGGPDTGIGEGGAAGAAGEVPPEPAPPEPDSRIYIREAGVGAVPQPPNGFTCPSAPPFPECVMSSDSAPALPYVSMGWNGYACCYNFYSCY